MDTLFLRVLRQWLPMTVAISVFCFMTAVALQQSIRMSANDPQIQLAEDTATELQKGKTVQLPAPIAIDKSLAPFVIMYDTHGNIVSSSASLNGKTPQLPHGALTGSKDSTQPGENRITWQPTSDVRLASVIVAFDKGYVLAGRNMQEIEIRENQEYQIIFFGYIIGLIATLSCVIFVQTILRPKK